MSLCTLWLIQGNAFFWCFLGEAELPLGYVTASSLTVHLLLLIAGKGLLFYVVYKNKEYQNDTGVGSCVVSLALS